MRFGFLWILVLYLVRTRIIFVSEKPHKLVHFLGQIVEIVHKTKSEVDKLQTTKPQKGPVYKKKRHLYK